MRILIAAASALLAGLYLTGSAFFYRQERWAREPPVNEIGVLSRLRHPEATLGLLRQHLEAGGDDDALLAGLQRALRQAPASYQSPFFVATYHANRLEEPAKVLRAFQIALKRFPANGRLHASYGRWLLVARTDLTAWSAIAEETPSLTDPLVAALDHLQTALRLEPDLLEATLSSLARYRIPPTQWERLVPDDDDARLQLVLFLQQRGHQERALELLAQVMERTHDPSLLRQGVDWALAWGEPALALVAAQKWDAIQEKGESARSPQANSTLSLVRAHLALDDPDAAYRAARGRLERLEASRGSSRRGRVQLLCEIGYQFLYAGQPLLAESIFTEAIALDPRNASASLALARSLHRSGDLVEAIEQYQNSLRLDSTLDEAKNELGLLLATMAKRSESPSTLEER